MECPSLTIPEYLHWNARKTYEDIDFLNDHSIYRIGNPIEFPSGTITAFSSKWSFLINQKDILVADDPPVGDDFRYAKVDELRSYLCQENKIDGANIGWHTLSCTFCHSPKECDYSHTEILIKHRISSDKNLDNIIQTYLYTYAIWQQNGALLQNKNAFYVKLRKDYRRDLIRLFCYPE